MIDFSSVADNFNVIYPELALLIGAFAVLLLGTVKRFAGLCTSVTGLTALIALWLAVDQFGTQQSGFFGMVTCDAFGSAFKIIFIAIAIVTMLIAHRFMIVKKIARPEFYALVLISTFGMMVMANTTDMIVMFLGLEIMSVPLYVMAGFARRSLQSNEAGIKYFVMGAFASAFLLMGIAFVFGASATTDLRRIVADFSYIIYHSGLYMYVGIALILVGFGFKIGMVPFHAWVPDVYQGAPTPVTAFFSAGPKAAGFAVLLRLFMFGFEGVAELSSIFWVLAVLTMTAGNVLALLQDNIKRMLAYSSIAHAGYILIAFAVGGEDALSAAIFYSIAYAIFNLGAFAVVVLLETRSGCRSDFSELAGLSKVSPYLCAVLALFVFALTGFPPTIGFFGKFYLFTTAVKAGFIWLAVIGGLNSFVSVYYYLRVLKVSYFDRVEQSAVPVSYTPAITLVLLITAAGTLGFGLFPQKLLEFAQSAVFAFL
ncbi:MAG: NADH-quinone oxidoreductase subunit N [candidate division Zixibacteria bacterium]|nr:NADH-quinone oxidoreductase subunit N [candidate division Zixibacteria bacterium]